MDYEKAYNEALERARAGKPMNEVFPELHESEDERMRTELCDIVRDVPYMETVLRVHGLTVEKTIAYLEKQKENPKTVDSISADCVSDVKWTDTIITRAIVALSDDVDYNKDEPCKYRREIDDLKKLRDVLCEQKEQKPSWTKIDNSRENVIFPFNARVKDSDKVVTIIDGQLNFDGKQWIRFSSNRDDGFKVYCPEDLLVEQQPAEKQDYSGLTELERAIHRGFLCAGIENVPVEIIKGTAQECRLVQMKSAEWSEDDEKIWKDIFDLCNRFGYDNACRLLKSISRRSWKPSEEQMEVLFKANPVNLTPEELAIYHSVYNDLTKL